MIDIPGYEGFYKINLDGDVYTMPINGTWSTDPYKLKRNTDKKTGYQSYFLQKNGVGKRLLVHRLVAITFLPNPKNNPVVNHKDGNKQNNNFENLEWCTRSENEIHAHATGLKNFKGYRATYRKINSDDVRSIRNLYATGNFTQREVAYEYNISQSNVNIIIKRKNWSSVW